MGHNILFTYIVTPTRISLREEILICVAVFDLRDIWEHESVPELPVYHSHPILSAALHTGPCHDSSNIQKWFCDGNL